jgi:hypothetical protein
MNMGAPEDAATMRIKKGRKAFQEGIVVVFSWLNFSKIVLISSGVNLLVKPSFLA